MAKVVFEQVAIMGLQVETITTRSGEQRTKETILFTDKSMTLHKAVAWGQDKVNELALEQGKKYDISCVLMPRQFGGDIIYGLQAYKAEEVKEQAKQEGGTDPFEL